MLHHILGATFHSATADGIAQSAKDIIAHAVTVVPEVAGRLTYLIWVVRWGQVQRIERLDYLVHRSIPQFLFPLGLPFLCGFSFPIDGVSHRPQALCSMMPVNHLFSFWEVGQGPIDDPGCAIVDGTQMGHLVQPAPESLGILMRLERVRIPQASAMAMSAQTYHLFVRSLPLSLSRPPTLLIVGAGHIALPLAQLGKLCDFDVVVLDDRASFANAERFPMADQVIAAPFEAALREFPLDEDTYIVLVTRGHQHDVACLLEVLDRPSAYRGMIGSRRRVRSVFQLLEEEKGIARERFERLYSPIGLDIGSETPAEIAVSIMAEIIKVRRGGTGLSLSNGRRRKRGN